MNSTLMVARWFGEHFFDDIVDYIASNLDVLDVFDRDRIKDCATSEFLPEEIFDAQVLSAWAEANGYILESEE